MIKELPLKHNTHCNYTYYTDKIGKAAYIKGYLIKHV